jgi:hypothetical protein
VDLTPVVAGWLNACSFLESVHFFTDSVWGRSAEPILCAMPADKCTPLPRCTCIGIQCLGLIGLIRTMYIRCLFGIFGRDFTKYTVIYIIYVVLANPNNVYLHVFLHTCRCTFVYFQYLLPHLPVYVIPIILYIIPYYRYSVGTCVGLARTIYTQCMYGIFGREITKYTVMYGVYVRFWPPIHMCTQCM